MDVKRKFKVKSWVECCPWQDADIDFIQRSAWYQSEHGGEFYLPGWWREEERWNRLLPERGGAQSRSQPKSLHSLSSLFHNNKKRTDARGIVAVREILLIDIYSWWHYYIFAKLAPGKLS